MSRQSQVPPTRYLSNRMQYHIPISSRVPYSRLDLVKTARVETSLSVNGPTIREVRHILREFTTLVDDKPGIKKRMLETSMSLTQSKRLWKKHAGQESYWRKI
ncbi:hypothetical protein SERLA73DRAFT_133694 [Serpula lacrymans var. lacrymans S7.3]|uniref:Uncharacterized protein n=1 Tax=Serpula lacrymans var. lacrymans (strain S7.3) TaxID=936435 RepID=F8PS87_SERL3|nr:hypothetical protein SERLA73DRAFT_133694 [Serpula lacrymans var. lacrymans S7.3]